MIKLDNRTLHVHHFLNKRDENNCFQIKKINCEKQQKMKKLFKICQGTPGLSYTSEEVPDDYLMNWENV